MREILTLHDAFAFPGGGEKVATLFARDAGADLWTAEYAPGAFEPGYFGDGPPHDLNALANHPLAARISKTLALLRAFANFPRAKARAAVFSGSLACMAASRIDAYKIHYCHTPPRILYDQRDFYLSRVRPLKRPVYKAFLAYYERAFKKALARMDVVAANSKNVQKRLRDFLGADSEIVHPPCETEKFPFLAQEDFYLSTARVDGLKRVDVIVEAFAAMPQKKLVVVSGGSELEKMKRRAESLKNVTILGWVDGKTLARLIGTCVAAIYIPRDEDFGISPVEAMAAGKPVIGVAEGGLLETVVHGETGILLPPDPTPEDAARAVNALTPEAALTMREACERRAALFDVKIFLQKMRDLIERAPKR